MGRPFSFLCISIIVGIFLGIFLNLTVDIYLLILVLLLMIIVTVFYKKYFVAYICIFFILLGNYVFCNQMQDITALKNYPLENSLLMVQVKSSGIKEGKYLRYDIDILKLFKDDKEIIINEKARLQIKNPSSLPFILELFDILILKEVNLVEDFSNKNLDSYQLYLRSKGFKGVIQVDAKDITKLYTYEKLNVINSSLNTRIYLENYFNKHLPSLEANILKSIMFGNQGYLDKETLNLFTISGTAHIIAVSGLHVGIIVLMLHYVLRFFKIGKNKIFIITMLILLFYSAMVNFPVSIIRASAMYYLYVFSYFIGRKYDAINSLMMIAFVLLLYNPFNLFSISFQLSFTATLSIILFFPYFRTILKIPFKYIQTLLAVTISAQLGTIPIMIYHFNQLSLIAFIANILIVPVLAPLLFMAFLSPFIFLIFQDIAVMINYLIHWILAYLYWIVKVLSNIPLASVKIEDISLFFVCIYYFILFAVYMMLWHNKIRLNAEKVYNMSSL